MSNAQLEAVQYAFMRFDKKLANGKVMSRLCDSALCLQPFDPDQCALVIISNTQLNIEVAMC